MDLVLVKVKTKFIFLVQKKKREVEKKLLLEPFETKENRRQLNSQTKNHNIHDNTLRTNKETQACTYNYAHY